MSGRDGEGSDLPRDLMMGAFSNLCNKFFLVLPHARGGQESTGYSMEFHVIPAVARCKMS